MTIWQTRANQNSQWMNGLFSPVDGFQMAGLGNTLPGPTLSGAVPRASMTMHEPRSWAPAKVAQTCRRERVWSRIIPRPTPWSASSTPSHSHRQVPLVLSATEFNDLALHASLTCKDPRRHPKGCTDPYQRYPTTSDTTSARRDRRQRRAGATSGPWSTLKLRQQSSQVTKHLTH